MGAWVGVLTTLELPWTPKKTMVNTNTLYIPHCSMPTTWEEKTHFTSRNIINSTNAESHGNHFKIKTALRSKKGREQTSSTIADTLVLLYIFCLK